ncbi:uncharacterized protein [Ptychodera flava]|uniref:uncharacterized protein n=1 Tax=Ptychodera flava TaxID=63121 RepID=UPI00396A89FA
MTGFLRLWWNRSVTIARSQSSIATQRNYAWSATNRVTMKWSMQAFRNQLGATSQRTVLSGPPQHKISGMENVIAFTVMFIGVCAVPGYLMANLDSYRTLPDTTPQEE